MCANVSQAAACCADGQDDEDLGRPAAAVEVSFPCVGVCLSHFLLLNKSWNRMI